MEPAIPSLSEKSDDITEDISGEWINQNPHLKKL
jgi:hypothetical protein